MIKMTAGGDALFVRPFPGDYSDKNSIRDLIMRGGLRAVNLETTITDGGCFGSAYSGGTWVTAGPEVLEGLKELGFNCFGIANNHTMDYSYDGLRQTLAALDGAGLAHCGAGENLDRAMEPAVINTEGGSIAVISVCSTFNMAAAAGAATPSVPGRPGLNPLRFSVVYEISRERLDALIAIEKELKVNGLKNLHREQGFELPLPEGVFEFGGTLFRAAGECGERRVSSCNKKDLERIAAGIRRAKESCDYAVVMVHSHEVAADSDEDADGFLEEFARACIDAGACAVIGGGTHRLKGIEIYKNAPIFYSLGNFIFQNSLVEKLPADFMEKYGIPITSTAGEAIKARAAMAKHSLAETVPCWRSVIPYAEIDENGLRELRLDVIELGMHMEGGQRNIPHPADENTVREVYEYLTRVSGPYGTRCALKGNYISVEL